MTRCPAHDDRTPSLGVTLGRRALLLHCFAGCDRQNVLAAFARQGIGTESFFSRNSISCGSTAGPSTADRAMSLAAKRIWQSARPIAATAAQIYLQRRGIRDLSPALRFHPRTPLGPKGRTQFLPALVASISQGDGPIAVHRTFLSPSGADKADLRQAKRALGALRDGAVRLFAPSNGRLGLAEGIESAMSARCLTGIATWATLGNARFGAVAIPDCVTELHLFVDHDEGGNLAAARGLTAYRRDGRSIQVRRPQTSCWDWNDELMFQIRTALHV